MTAEQLAQHKKEAEAERDRLLVALHRVNGAIAMLDFLVKQASQPADEEAGE